MRETPARQRLTVVFGRLMHSFPAAPAKSNYTTRIHPLLTSFADEVCGTLARLCAYGMLLALIAIGGIALWDRLPDAAAMAPPARAGWTQATRSAPATRRPLTSGASGWRMLAWSHSARRSAASS